MGGCRCSYKNCTVRSDGQTHMFHYPVFDKARCHQWLVNAQRQDFLNLKVSQLRNRVICQYHFEDPCFMNYKKKKLKFDAIPNLDGPFCDTKVLPPDTSDLLPVLDIENDCNLSKNEKIANFPVKYGDFLSMELDSLTDMTRNNAIDVNETELSNLQTSNLNNSNIPMMINFDNIRNSSLKRPKRPIKKHNTTNFVLKNNNTNVLVPKITGVSGQGQIVTKIVNTSHSHANTIEEINAAENPVKIPDGVAYKYEIPIIEIKPKVEQRNEQGSVRSKIKILSEERVSEPLPIRGNLRPVSPSLVLTLPDRRKSAGVANVQQCQKVEMLDVKFPINKIDGSEIDTKNSLTNKENTVQQEYAPENYTTQIIIEDPPIVTPKEVTYIAENKVSHNILPTVNNTEQKTHDIKRNTGLNQKIIQKDKSKIALKSPSLLKNKITPERVAAINQKRKYNMKLRDIIESCLDKLDDHDKIIDNQVIQSKEVKKHQSGLKVAQFVSANTNKLPSMEENTMSYIEARLRRMEDNLISKIDQNTKRILDLKAMIAPDNKSSASGTHKKATTTQTTESEEDYKRHLYKEISKFLSPSANSSIFEELFVNKYDKNSTQSPGSAKRKRFR